MGVASFKHRLKQAEAIHAWLAKTDDAEVKSALQRVGGSNTRALSAVFAWRLDTECNIASLRNVGASTIDQLYRAATWSDDQDEEKMSCEHCGAEDSVLTSKLTYTPAFLCARCAEDQAIRNRTEKAELEAERDRLAEYLERWQAWSRKLHHDFGWLPETVWPDDTKGREKIRHELERLREMHRSFEGHVYVANEKYTELSQAQRQLQRIQATGTECPDCGGTGIGPTVVPAPGESAETGWCPTCEGGGTVTKEYTRLREKKE